MSDSRYDHARDVVICEPLRTPVGRYGGVFKDVSVTTYVLNPGEDRPTFVFAVGVTF